MAIDVSTFAADLPAGTYTAGQIVQLKNTAGPATVRSGRGAAKLKRISSFLLTDTNGSSTGWMVYIQNSDWVDSAANVAVPMNSATAADIRSGSIQAGHDCPLTENSAWNIYAVCVNGGTTTVGNSITCEIEIDYPQVSSVTNPNEAYGIPCSITHEVTGIAMNATDDGTTATWETFNVDIFKAGYEYALEKVELFTTAASGVSGYIAIANAAGMGGLTRIIPISSQRANIRPFIEYASVLRKGPMDIKYKLFNIAGSSGTTDVKLIFDFVKRRI